MKKGALYGLLAAVFLSNSSFSQENIFTAGFQYKPIFSSAFFSTGTKTVTQNNIDFSITQRNGYCAGMIIRRGINKRFSFETGINYVKRNFDLDIKDTSFTGSSDFKIIGYEIPVQGLIFLQMSKKVFMNSSAGMSMDMYPSNIQTYGTYYGHNSSRHAVFQFSALANLGWEYRTEKSGYFYLGASYHLPLSWFYSSIVQYKPTKDVIRMKLGGNYLTLDFRYYFHEDPLKPKKKEKKK